MTYYLALKSDQSEYMEIGESSFKNFWVGDGFKILKNIINFSPDTLIQYIIKREDGKELDIEKFLTEIEKLNIIDNRGKNAT